MIARSSIKKDDSVNRIQELDSLRGIAAIVVLVFHYSLLQKDLLTFTKFGVTGVDLFFIISGFVITMSLERVQFGYQFESIALAGYTQLIGLQLYSPL